MNQKALAFKYKVKNTKERIKNGKCLLAIVMLATGISWTISFYEYQELKREYDKAIQILQSIEQRSGEVVVSQSDDEAATQASSTSEQETSDSPAPARELTVEMSAYTSRVEETDDSPCISADNTNICEYDGCVVASNGLDLGTIVEVEGFGECTVKDRMNSRYGMENMDIYFGHDLDGALAFGRQMVKITVIDDSSEYDTIES